MTIKKKVSVWFVSLKVLEATFCVGVKTKRPTRNTVCIRETPVKVCGVCPRRQKILGTALKIMETVANGKDILRKSFQKSQKLLNLRNMNH